VGARERGWRTMFRPEKKTIRGLSLFVGKFIAREGWGIGKRDDEFKKGGTEGDASKNRMGIEKEKSAIVRLKIKEEETCSGNQRGKRIVGMVLEHHSLCDLRKEGEDRRGRKRFPKSQEWRSRERLTKSAGICALLVWPCVRRGRDLVSTKAYSLCGLGKLPIGEPSSGG